MQRSRDLFQNPKNRLSRLARGSVFKEFLSQSMAYKVWKKMNLSPSHTSQRPATCLPFQLTRGLETAQRSCFRDNRFPRHGRDDAWCHGIIKITSKTSTWSGSKVTSVASKNQKRKKHEISWLGSLRFVMIEMIYIIQDQLCFFRTLVWARWLVAREHSEGDAPWLPTYKLW